MGLGLGLGLELGLGLGLGLGPGLGSMRVAAFLPGMSAVVMTMSTLVIRV